jgi:hypothetical protein
MWDAATRLFAANAWAEVSGAGGIFVGRERLGGALQALYGGRRAGVFELNQIAQPVIHSAEGIDTRVRARLARIDAVEDGDDAYSAGVYEAADVERDCAWLIDALDF